MDDITLLEIIRAFERAEPELLLYENNRPIYLGNIKTINVRWILKNKDKKIIDYHTEFVEVKGQKTLVLVIDL